MSSHVKLQRESTWRSLSTKGTMERPLRYQSTTKEKYDLPAAGHPVHHNSGSTPPSRSIRRLWLAGSDAGRGELVPALRDAEGGALTGWRRKSIRLCVGTSRANVLGDYAFVQANTEQRGSFSRGARNALRDHMHSLSKELGLAVNLVHFRSE